jgi:hypothetical protein
MMARGRGGGGASLSHGDLLLLHAHVAQKGTISGDYGRLLHRDNMGHDTVRFGIIVPNITAKTFITAKKIFLG